MMHRVIEATILTGNYKNEDVFIPRIPMIPTDLPFDFKRLQLPLKLSFTLTIDKAHGQTLDCIGIIL